MRMIWGLIGLGLLALAMSFMGAVHGIGDSLAVFRTGLCALLLILAGVVKSGGTARLAVIVVGLAGLGTVFWHKIPMTSAGPISLYQKNVLLSNGELPVLAADILAAKPDFVTLQEVSVTGEVLLDELKDAYPHQHICRYSEFSGVAVLSRIAFVNDRVCERRYGMARVTVDLPTGRHDVAAIHLAWPFPGDQPQQVRHMLADLQTLDHPILIGGDFNMVPWSHTLAQVARASGTKRAGPARTTFLLGSVPIAIDHVFAPGGGYAQARPLFGGDHFGILAQVHGASN